MLDLGPCRFIVDILAAKEQFFFKFVKQDVHAGVPTLFSLRPGQLRMESLDLIGTCWYSVKV